MCCARCVRIKHSNEYKLCMYFASDAMMIHHVRPPFVVLILVADLNMNILEFHRSRKYIHTLHIVPYVFIQHKLLQHLHVPNLLTKCCYRYRCRSSSAFIKFVSFNVFTCYCHRQCECE